MNDRLRERKVDFQDLKEPICGRGEARRVSRQFKTCLASQDQFKRELKVEFPQASEERLQAMAQRLPREMIGIKLCAATRPWWRFKPHEIS